MLKRLMSQALPERGRSPRRLFEAPGGGAAGCGAGVEAGGATAAIRGARDAAPSAAWWLWLSGMSNAVERGGRQP